MKKIFLSTTILLLTLNVLVAQSPNTYGAINTSIPLFNLEYQGMQIPIVLTYSQMGVQVDELADWTGQGWQLNTGWIQQQRLPDLASGGSSFDKKKDFPNISFFGGSYSIFRKSVEHYDYNEDVFTDKAGIQHHFGKKGANNVWGLDRKHYLEPDMTNSIIERKYITSIKNYDAGDAEIIYNYVRKNEVRYIESYDIRADFDEINTTFAQTHVQRNYVKYSPVALTSITCPDWTLEFTVEDYPSSQRGYRLTEIILKDSHGFQVRKYTFSYDEYICSNTQQTYNESGEFCEDIDGGLPSVPTVNNRDRFFLSSIQAYDQNNNLKDTWELDYYSPELLPTRISIRKNPWGYFGDYKHLGSKFFEVINHTELPLITYNPNPARLFSHIKDYDDVVLSRLPHCYFDLLDATLFSTRKNAIQNDLNRDYSEVLYGMLKSITNPLDGKKVFSYSTKPYGNLLTNVTQTDENDIPISSVNFSYEDGAIPLSGFNYIALRDISSITPENLFSNSNITQFSCFGTGSRFILEQPTFKKVIASKKNMGSTVNIFTTAADPGADNLPAEIIWSSQVYISQANTAAILIGNKESDDNDTWLLPFGYGNPTSMAHKRGLLQMNVELNQAGDTLSKIESEYNIIESPSPYDFIEYKLGDQITSENLFQLESYFKGMKSSLGAQTNISTSFEYSAVFDEYIPVSINQTKYVWDGSNGYYLNSVENKRYTAGVATNQPEHSSRTEYYYQRHYPSEANIGRYSCPGIRTGLHKVPSSEFRFVNDEFVEGTMKIYKTTDNTITESETEFSGYQSIINDTRTMQLSEGGNSYDSDDEVLVVMDKSDFSKYGYQYYDKEYKYFPKATFSKSDNGGTSWSQLYAHGSDNIPASGSESHDDDKVYFIITLGNLDLAHTYIENNHPGILSQPIAGFQPKHVTLYLADYIVLTNSSAKSEYFTLSGLFTGVSLVSTSTDLEIIRYAYEEDYSTTETSETACADISVSKIIKLEPEDYSPCTDPVFCPLIVPLNFPINIDERQTLVSFDVYDEEFEDYPVLITDKKGLSTGFVYYDNHQVRYKIVNTTIEEINNWQISQTDIRTAIPNAYITEYKYDSFGRLNVVVDPNGVSKSYTYNAEGKPHKIIEGVNIVKEFNYTRY